MKTHEPFYYATIGGETVKIRAQMTHARPWSEHNPLGYNVVALESLIFGKPVPLDAASNDHEILKRAGYAWVIVSENRLCYAATQAALLEYKRYQEEQLADNAQGELWT